MKRALRMMEGQQSSAFILFICGLAFSLVPAQFPPGKDFYLPRGDSEPTTT